MVTKPAIELSPSEDNFPQPNFILDSIGESYRKLIAALDLGWEVKQPVFMFPDWNGGDQWLFQFIIAKNPANPPCVITTRYSSEIGRLVEDEGWKVVNFHSPTTFSSISVQSSILLNTLQNSYELR